MQPHQQRVVDERNELKEKLAKLIAFFITSTYATLDSAEQARLLKQGGIMQQYVEVLDERIAAFPK